MQEPEILELLHNREGVEFEAKLASGGLPRSLWETYSAFANTDGGIILLGLEEKKERFTIEGIPNPDTLQKAFWDTINNPQKVSVNLLHEQHVQVLPVSGKPILIIKVPRATREERPVYLNDNPFYAYRRNYEGDYRCSREEVNRMLADRSTHPNDATVLDTFDMNDIYLESLHSYRARLASRNPAHPFLAFQDQEFLQQIGGWDQDRRSGKQGLTLAGLLMFGKARSITSAIPHFLLDYRESMSDLTRWTHRVVSNDGLWPGNVYEFFFRVIHRLTADINVPFRMQHALREDDTPVHAALREALVNTLVHADYRGQGSLVIRKERTQYVFENPGGLRIPIEKALRGGTSDPRNALLFNMFAYIGIGERAGSGLLSIQNAWKAQHWRAPELTEEYQPERTFLTLRTISLLPADSLQFLERCLEEYFAELQQTEVLALVTAHLEGHVTNTRLQSLTQMNPLEVNKCLSGLVDKGFLVSTGQKRGTKYWLSELFDSTKQNDVEEAVVLPDQPVTTEEQPVFLQSIPVDLGAEPVSSTFSDELVSLATKARENRKMKAEDMRSLIIRLCQDQPLTLSELATLLHRKPESLRVGYIADLVKQNLLEPIHPPNHPRQAYRTKTTSP